MHQPNDFFKNKLGLKPDEADYLVGYAKSKGVFDNAKAGARSKLIALCRKNVELQAMVFFYLIYMHIAKSSYERLREDTRKDRNKDFTNPEHIKREIGAATKRKSRAWDELFGNTIPIFDPEVEKEILKIKMDTINQSLHAELKYKVPTGIKEKKEEYKNIYKFFLKSIVKMVMAETGKPIGTRSQSDASIRLAEFLNSIDFTTFSANKPFSRENILNAIKSKTDD